MADGTELKFKEGDSLRQLVPCQTTDRLCLLASNGRTFTLRAGDLPRGRGDGQPIRVLVELAQDDTIAALFVWQDGGSYLLASNAGRGFLIAAGELLAEKRTGKQVMNVPSGGAVALCLPVVGDHLAVIGTNRKLLVFPLDQVAVMARGGGVTLQRYAGGTLADARMFTFADGLMWQLGDRTRTEAMGPWLGVRGQVGRMPPNGFPKSGKFSG